MKLHMSLRLRHNYLYTNSKTNNCDEGLSQTNYKAKMPQEILNMNFYDFVIVLCLLKILVRLKSLLSGFVSLKFVND